MLSGKLSLKDIFGVLDPDDVRAPIPDTQLLKIAFLKMSTDQASESGGPSDAELAEVVAKIRRIRRQNRIAHIISGVVLLVSFGSVWFAFGQLVVEVKYGGNAARLQLILACSVAAAMTRFVYKKLESKENSHDDS